MGLAGRKVKQRIPNDPRNLSWADDAARFGSNYLAKFGWDASKGLGAEGEGRLSHIKVTQKLDMMGIGAAHQMDPNGIAWKQNKDFENLLRRLNEGSGDAEAEAGAGGTKVEGFKRADEGKKAEDEGEGNGGEGGEVKPAEGEKKKKKRKDKEGGEDDSERKKKKRKKEKEEAVESEKTEVVVAVESAMDVDKGIEDKSVVVVEVKRPVVPRHRAHRARAIAAKNISSKSAAHISEILGVAPTPSSSSYSSTPTPAPESQSQGKLTSLTDPSDTQLELDKITTSTKSLADYFKEKLAAKSSGSPTPSSLAAASPRATVDNYDGKEDDDFDTPRMGLGGLGFSRAKLEVQSETVKVEEATQRMGMSKFSALMSSSFLAATSLPSTFSSKEAEEDEKKDSSDDEEAEEKVKEKKEKKEKKKKEKKVKEPVEEAEEQVVEEKTEKKKKKEKKDKKGKDKAVDTEPATEEPVAEEADDKTEKKKKKKDKDKRRKAAESADEETPAKANESAPEDVEPKKKKEKKRKSKSEDSEAAAEAEAEKKSGKEKKKKHRTSDEDS
ncbi:hypothetical protein CVT26_011378 [Gymnopilus dilepis]|uniref:PinX1-related protein 1 n=1 Tax=Gymnopilus dilepis TaxID=231916 RepID=A0A409YHC5_9AGAR|nr:hypothetical protein CVT26_011378 [Gymnopilus dilepis]